MTSRWLIVLLALAAAIVGAQSASAENSPNMRLAYSLPDPTSGRTDSDIAFWGNIGVAGNYDGFRVFNTQTQQQLVSYLCRGPQNDVSLWEHEGRLLLFQSIDTPQANGDTQCSPVRTSDRGTSDPSCNPDPVHPCFEGIRIFDLTNPAAPVYLKGVYTDCGSHTHTLIPDEPNNRLLFYVSSYTSGTGPRCQNPHAKISIVSVPLDAPEKASVIAQPPIEAPPWGGFGVGCHDITVFLAIDLAAASCLSEGQLWDISDPANPDTLNAVHIDDAAVSIWHSAEFTWDGQYVVFDDEGSGTCTPNGNGKVWIYRVSDAQLMSSFMVPRPQGVYCSSHNGNIIPVNGRYLLVAAWYGGGTSVVDFTNPVAPVEVGYYDAAGPNADTWSSYWYNGRIYANDMARGVDVFNLITPYRPYGQQWTHLNAQTQEDLYLPSVTALGQLSPAR